MSDVKANAFLVGAAILNAIAAALHLGCIVFGAPWYRFFGAGERMAQLAIAGSWYPAVVATAIAVMLCTWSLFALSGAGVIRKLPLVRTVLCLITSVYLLRGTFVLPFMAYFPGRSISFWWWSSAICFAIGMVHLIGLRQVWSRLSGIHRIAQPLSTLP